MPKDKNNLDSDNSNNDILSNISGSKINTKDSKGAAESLKQAAEDNVKPVKTEKPKSGRLKAAIGKVGSLKKDSRTDNGSDIDSNTSELKKTVNPKSLAIKVLAILIVLVALFIVTFGVLIYALKSEGPAVQAVSKYLPYPVARVNGEFVPYYNYLFRLQLEKNAKIQDDKLNSRTTDESSKEWKDFVKEARTASMDYVKQLGVVEDAAKERKIEVSSKELNDTLTQLYENNGGKQKALAAVKESFNFSENDLSSEIKRQLLFQKLATAVQNDSAVDKQAKELAANISSQAKAGSDFAELAKKYSQASDAASGGDYGTFTKGQVGAEVQTAIDALAVGGVSDPVKDQYGYNVIKVTEKNGDSYRASHILIKTVDFNTYLSDQVKAAKYNQYVKL